MVLACATSAVGSRSLVRSLVDIWTPGVWGSGMREAGRPAAGRRGIPGIQGMQEHTGKLTSAVLPGRTGMHQHTGSVTSAILGIPRLPCIPGLAGAPGID